MGLFDALAQEAGNLLAGKLGANPNALSVAESLVREHGGLAGLLEKFNDAGLQSQVSSWIGTGANQPISAQNILAALGDERVAAIARRLGVDPQQAASHLAEIIPGFVDRLTPQGVMPDDNAIASALGAIRTKLGV